MEGTRKSARCKIGILRAVVIILIGPRRCEKRRPVDADRLAVRNGHMSRTVIGHKPRQLRLAAFRRGVIGKVVLRQILLRRILILRKVLRHIGQVVAHAGHRRRTAAGIEPRARHDVESALVGLVLRGQSDVLCDGVAHERIEFIPIHQAHIHVEKAESIELRRRLRVVVRAVLADAVRHLVPEHGGEFVNIAVQPLNQTAVDAHIVRRIACGIKDRTVIDRPREGE